MSTKRSWFSGSLWRRSPAPSTQPRAQRAEMSGYYRSIVRTIYQRESKGRSPKWPVSCAIGSGVHAQLEATCDGPRARESDSDSDSDGYALGALSGRLWSLR
jgi:hypothetical protein